MRQKYHNRKYPNVQEREDLVAYVCFDTNMVSLIVNIPADVLCDRVTPFFDLKSLVRLDSALLSRKHRTNMLDKVLRDATLDQPVDYDLQHDEVADQERCACDHFSFPSRC